MLRARARACVCLCVCVCPTTSIKVTPGWSANYAGAPRLAVGGDGVALHDIGAEMTVASLEGPRVLAMAAAASDLVIGSERLQVWDIRQPAEQCFAVENPRPHRTVDWQTPTVSCVAIDASKLVCVDYGQYLFVWDRRRLDRPASFICLGDRGKTAVGAMTASHTHAGPCVRRVLAGA